MLKLKYRKKVIPHVPSLVRIGSKGATGLSLNQNNSCVEKNSVIKEIATEGERSVRLPQHAPYPKTKRKKTKICFFKILPIR